jgi:hypothetical protein
MLRPTVSQLACLGVKPQLGPKTTFLLLSDSCRSVMLGALSDKKTGLTFTIAAGRRQCRHIYAVKISSTRHLYLQFYMSIFHTVGCGRLLFTVLHVTLVYMYVQGIQGLAEQIMP